MLEWNAALSFNHYLARADGSLPDNEHTPLEEVGIIRVFPAIINEFIPDGLDLKKTCDFPFKEAFLFLAV